MVIDRLNTIYRACDKKRIGVDDARRVGWQRTEGLGCTA
jgi:hypothetical protein